ncbi:hypothetical protein E6C27_scaffold55G00560 [Cucumis melo var. makuwa]|uniref:Uncharacterized protein n=1 Tax=Cucumis melo var. makuwa TaxID=1194695 RepID=A0A5A7UAW0_CUCMM|nr:hypothetical protein E6C27_scaffold55G00560 [Cucumis melo var. makuwa]
MVESGPVDQVRSATKRGPSLREWLERGGRILLVLLGLISNNKKEELQKDQLKLNFLRCHGGLSGGMPMLSLILPGQSWMEGQMHTRGNGVKEAPMKTRFGIGTLYLSQSSASRLLGLRHVPNCFLPQEGSSTLPGSYGFQTTEARLKGEERSIGNERRSGGMCGTPYWITPVRHEAADAESAPMPLAMPCLVPRHGGGSVARHEHRAKGRFFYSSEPPYLTTT